LKPAQPNSLQDSYLKKPFTKNWAGGGAQGEGPEFKPQYHKKIKNVVVIKDDYGSCT
jgi:hypothetical protein